MAWIKATRLQYSWPHDDRQNHLTDAEREPMVPLIPRLGRMGRAGFGHQTLGGCSTGSGPCRPRGTADAALSSAVSTMQNLARVQRAACRFLMRRGARRLEA